MEVILKEGGEKRPVGEWSYPGDPGHLLQSQRARWALRLERELFMGESRTRTVGEADVEAAYFSVSDAKRIPPEVLARARFRVFVGDVELARTPARGRPPRVAPTPGNVRQQRYVARQRALQRPSSELLRMSAEFLVGAPEDRIGSYVTSSRVAGDLAHYLGSPGRGSRFAGLSKALAEHAAALERIGR